jgi:hypothetical protein
VPACKQGGTLREPFEAAFAGKDLACLPAFARLVAAAENFASAARKEPVLEQNRSLDAASAEVWLDQNHSLASVAEGEGKGWQSYFALMDHRDSLSCNLNISNYYGRLLI